MDEVRIMLVDCVLAEGKVNLLFVFSMLTQAP